MSSFKKFGWSGAAAFFAVVMTLGLMAQQVFAAVTVSPPTTTVSTTTNPATGSGVYTTLQNFTLTGSAIGDFVVASCVFTAPAGWQFNPASAPTVDVTGAGLAAGPAVVTASTITVPVTAANTAAPATLTLNFSAAPGDVRPATASTVSGPITITTNACTPTLPTGSTVENLVATAGTPYSCVLTSPTTSVPANGSVGTPVTVTVTDSQGNVVQNLPVSWSVSQGTLGTGTSKTATSFTNSSGQTTQTYRGGGNQAGTDTIIASNSSGNMVCTLDMTMTAASGTTASNMVFNGPQNQAIAATITNTAPGYVSPTFGTLASLQVRDASGLGVDGQTVLLTVNRGAIIDGQTTSCVGATGKSITATTATEAPVTGATAQPGTIAFTICANQSDAPGTITVTAQNVSTAMTNATMSLTQAGRPAKIAATTTGNVINVLVTDANDIPVADGTVVRFTISPNAGAVSTSCTTTSNGRASAVASLNQGSGTVLITAEYNETGTAPTCAATGAAATNLTSATGGTGSHTLAGSATIGGGGTTPPPGQCAEGTIISGSIPRNGGFGLIVYCGGTVQQLVTATGCPVATMALWYTVGGNFVIYVPGTTITAVNADFFATFPGGNIPANTPFIGKCV